jgi:hypothetical protein
VWPRAGAGQEPLAPRVLVVGHFAQDDLRGNAFAREEVRELLEQLHVVRTAVEVQDSIVILAGSFPRSMPDTASLGLMSALHKRNLDVGRFGRCQRASRCATAPSAG